MPHFTNDGYRLACMDEGSSDAPAILLVHGFASSMKVNWVDPGWVQTLTQAGYRVLAFDHRGHGDSDKPKDPDAYTPQAMVGDTLACLDHFGVEAAHLFGYSMGARVAAFAALEAAQRWRKLVFGGLGMGLIDGVGDWDPIADALLADSIEDVSDARGRMFRAFADKTDSDREALAACIHKSRAELTREEVARIEHRTLIGVGNADEIAGAPQPLADAMPNAEVFAIERRDHMLAVGDRTFKRAVLDFLDRD